MKKRRKLLAPAVAVLAVLAAPAAAGAATLNGSSFNITYTAGAGETNSVTVERVGSVYRFTDAPGITISGTGDCTAAGNVGTCPAPPGFSQIFVLLEDMNDTLNALPSLPATLDMSLNGGDGNDNLAASGPSDAFLNGDDFGGPPGDDILVGGSGDQALSGGPGNDTLLGGADDDRLQFDDGADVLQGNQGNDSFGGGSGPDGPDSVTGGDGQDSLDLRSRLDDLRIDLDGQADDGAGCPGPTCEGDNYRPDLERVDSGDGDDILIGSAGSESLSSGAGDDLIQGEGGNDTLSDFGDSADRLEGGPGGDSMFSGEGADMSAGGPGDDLFNYEFFDESSDTVRGGAGFDSISGVEEDEDPIRVSLNDMPDDGFRGALFDNPKDNIGADVEDATGSLSSDVLIGSPRPNQLSGLDGRDRLVGLAGQDALIGARGRDLLVGGRHRDALDGGGGPDRLRSRDRRPDDLRCGSAVDRVKADRVDRFGPDCDKVSLRRRR